MTHQPLTKEDRSAILSDSITSGLYTHAIKRLCADLDAAEDKIYGLKSRICGLDCRYTMGDVADISGSHCTQPCERCLADRDLRDAEARADAAEAKLAAVTDVPDDIHEAIEELAESAYAWAESDTEPVSEQAAKERTADSRLRVMVNRMLAQRDRAEAELAAERRMRVEADAASDRLMAEIKAMRDARKGR